jgi:lipoprotein-anchoring transpeptidase ErfK/SrfK
MTITAHNANQYQICSMRKRSTQDLLIHSHTLSRRSVIAGLPLLVAGCSDSGRFGPFSGRVQDGAFTVPEINLANIDPSLVRQEVAWRGHERAGSIVVVVPERRLYLVQGNGRALRYAVGVGRAEALNFRGSAVIGRKESWPRWTPTAHMMAAMPSYRLAVWTAAPNNPLGARALYLYRDGGDTYLRLHGTNEPESIGHAVSSGCIRCSIRISLISTTASRWARM